LKLVCDEKEVLLQHEVSDRKKLEKEVEQLQSLLTKRTAELNNSMNYATTFRKEGRTTRKQVLEVVGIVTEIVNTLSLDMQLGFTDHSSSNTTVGNSTLILSTTDFNDPNSSVSTSNLKLIEALGLHTLSDMINKLKDLSTKYIADHHKLKTELIHLSQVEVERDALRGQVNGLLEQRSVLTSQHIEEKKSLQQQLLRLKNDDSEVHKLLTQISNLEFNLRREKERKEKVIEELNEVKNEVERLTGSSLAVRERTNVSILYILIFILMCNYPHDYRNWEMKQQHCNLKSNDFNMTTIYCA
jgi:hypothetical protein